MASVVSEDVRLARRLRRGRARRLRLDRPDDEQFAFITDLVRPVGTYLNGRRLYESMAVWETDPRWPRSRTSGPFADVWQATTKVVYSTTLDAVSTAKSRLERRFDPDAVREMKDTSGG